MFGIALEEKTPILQDGSKCSLIFGLNIFISENNIHGNYNIIIYINVIRSALYYWHFIWI